MTEEIRRYVRPDGKQIVCVVELDGGLFSFTEEIERWEEAHPAIGDGYAYWTGPERIGGLYDSVEAVEREVKLLYPWVSDKPAAEKQRD